MSENENLFALLIDGDNANSKMIQAILERVNTLGKVIIKKVYYNKSSLGHWESIINTYSLHSVYVPNNIKNKNSVDITLVVDAMALLYRRPDLDSFCIVASDADYTALAKQIRTENKYVLGIGEAKTPEMFRNACSHFIYIEDLVKPAAPAQPVINSSDRAFLRLMIRAYKQISKTGVQDKYDRMTLREMWEQMKTLDAAFSSEYQMMLKFVNKLKALAAIYPDNIVLEEQADAKPVVHYIRIQNGTDQPSNSEIDKFRKAYNHAVQEPKFNAKNGWVSLSAIGTILRDMYPNYPYHTYAGVKHRQLKKVVERMKADHPSMIELNGNKQVPQIRFKR